MSGKKLLFWLGCLFSLHVQGQISNTENFDNAEQAALYREMVRIIRCPTCQNQDIAESGAPLAKQLRELIGSQIREGKNAEEITDFLVARYGDFITYAPRVQKNTLILWFAPLLLMAAAALYWLLKRSRRPLPPLSAEQRQQLQSWLQQYGDPRA